MVGDRITGIDKADLQDLEAMLKEDCKLNFMGDKVAGAFKWQFFRFMGAGRFSLLGALVDFVWWAVKALTASWWEHHMLEEYIRNGESIERYRRMIVAYLEADYIWKMKE